MSMLGSELDLAIDPAAVLVVHFPGRVEGMRTTNKAREVNGQVLHLLW